MVADIVAWLLAGGVALLIARRLRKILTGDANGCGCGGGGCGQPRSRDQNAFVSLGWEDAE